MTIRACLVLFGALLTLVAAGCTGDDPDDDVVFRVADLPAPGSLSSPAEGYAIYDPSIDDIDICGDGSKRVGPQILTDYLAPFDIGATNYARNS